MSHSDWQGEAWRLLREPPHPIWCEIGSGLSVPVSCAHCPADLKYPPSFAPETISTFSSAPTPHPASTLRRGRCAVGFSADTQVRGAYTHIFRRALMISEWCRQQPLSSSTNGGSSLHGRCMAIEKGHWQHAVPGIRKSASIRPRARPGD